MKRKLVVTLMNSISETSMPLNEFVFYRNKAIGNEEHVIISLSKKWDDSIVIPNRVTVYSVGKNIFRIRKIMNSLYRKCKKLNLELVVHLHHPKSAFLFYWVSIFKRYTKKTLFTVHSMFASYTLKNKILSLFSVIKSERITFVSRASYLAYPKFPKRIKEKKMTTIQNGVDLKRINDVLSRTKKKSTTNNKTLVYIARISPVKNHKFLINILPNLNFCKLYLVGVEDKQGEIRSLIKKLDLGNKVEITGLIPRNKVFEILRNSDLYVSPSKVEGLPVSLLEAMYCGLPVVASDIEPHLEIAKHTSDIITLPLNEDVWIERLNSLLDADKYHLVKLGGSLKRIAQEHFSLDSMTRKYTHQYDELS